MCIFCVYVNYYDLRILSKSEMGFQKLLIERVGSIQFFLGFPPDV